MVVKKKSGGVTFIKGGGKKTLAGLMSKGPKGHISKINKKEKKKSNKPVKKGRPPTHGKSDTPEYRSWRNAKQRCNNPNFPQYKDYGGRGIEFKFTFEEFFEEIGERPDGHSLDRIDPDGNYEPGNIQWASRKSQAENRRSSNFYKEQALEHIKEREKIWFEMAQQWDACVASANGVRIPKDLRGPMEKLRTERNKILPQATWKKGQTRDRAEPLSDSLYMPALTVFDAEVTFSCHPYIPSGKSEAHNRGILEGLLYMPLRANGWAIERKKLKAYWNKFKRGKVAGWCLTGNLYSEFKSPKFPERFLMAFAAELLGKEKRPAFFMPMVSLATLLEDDQKGVDYGGKHYKSPWLIIPDMSIDAKKGFSLHPYLLPSLGSLLLNRMQAGFQTIVFAHNPDALGSHISNFFDASYHVT